MERKDWIRKQMGWAKQWKGREHVMGKAMREDQAAVQPSHGRCVSAGKRVPQGWLQKDRDSHDEMKRTRDLIFRTSSESSPEVEVSARTDSSTIL